MYLEDHSQAENDGWIRDDTWAKVGERKKERKKEGKAGQQKRTASAKYSAVVKDVKKQLRADKRAYITDIADQAEKAARKRRSKDSLCHDQIPRWKLEQLQQQAIERQQGG